MKPIQYGESGLTDPVRMVPLKIVTPNGDCVYAPSRIWQPFWTERRKLEAIAGYAKTLMVSFAPDGVSDPQPVTAYGLGWYCWWMVG